VAAEEGGEQQAEDVLDYLGALAAVFVGLVELEDQVDYGEV
jgi:hypothetical protein